MMERTWRLHFRLFSAIIALLLVATLFGGCDSISPYQKGYDGGYSDGYSDGYNEAYEEGYSDGLDAGYDSGIDVGYDDGYKTGVNFGYEVGQEVAYNDKISEDDEEQGRGRFITGFYKGYDAGLQNGTTDDVAADATDALIEALKNAGYDEPVSQIRSEVLREQDERIAKMRIPNPVNPGNFFQSMEELEDYARQLHEAAGDFAPSRSVPIADVSPSPTPAPTPKPTPSQTPAPTPSPTPVPVRTNPDTSMTVYITNTGTKYHRSGCSYLSKSKIAISLNDAKARGYTACSRCW